MDSAPSEVVAQTPAAADATTDDPKASLYAGGDGLSVAAAVVVLSKSDVAGVRSEYTWIAEYYPGYKVVSQALTAGNDSGKRYDRISITTRDGQNLVLWFDISAMYK
jgi:hypothetical protein